MGSRTSARAAWTTRSRVAGIPRRRHLPAPFGIICSRTGSGVNRCPFSSDRRSDRKAPTPRPASMERAVWPSTPAERAPLFPRTRAHATISVAGSTTRLNRSSNRRSGSSPAQRCSFVWIPSTRGRASARLGQDASVFTGDLLACQSADCERAAALPHVPGFPVLGVLRRLRPVPVPSADDEPARRPAGCGDGRAGPGRFPCSPCADRQGQRPALPRQPRHEYAAGLPRSLERRRQ